MIIGKNDSGTISERQKPFHEPFDFSFASQTRVRGSTVLVKRDGIFLRLCMSHLVLDHPL
jgi:hypothetical protein